MRENTVARTKAALLTRLHPLDATMYPPLAISSTSSASPPASSSDPLNLLWTARVVSSYTRSGRVSVHSSVHDAAHPSLPSRSATSASAVVARTSRTRNVVAASTSSPTVRESARTGSSSPFAVVQVRSRSRSGRRRNGRVERVCRRVLVRSGDGEGGRLLLLLMEVLVLLLEVVKLLLVLLLLLLVREGRGRVVEVRLIGGGCAGRGRTLTHRGRTGRTASATAAAASRTVRKGAGAVALGVAGEGFCDEGEEVSDGRERRGRRRRRTDGTDAGVEGEGDEILKLSDGFGNLRELRIQSASVKGLEGENAPQDIAFPSPSLRTDQQE